MKFLLPLLLVACSASPARHAASATFHCDYQLGGKPGGELQFSRSFGGTPEVSWNDGKTWEKFEATPSPASGQIGLVSWQAGTITDRAFFAVNIPEDYRDRDSFEGRTFFATEERFDPMAGSPLPVKANGAGTLRCTR